VYEEHTPAVNHRGLYLSVHKVGPPTVARTKKISEFLYTSLHAFANILFTYINIRRDNFNLTWSQFVCEFHDAVLLVTRNTRFAYCEGYDIQNGIGAKKCRYLEF